MPQYLIPVWMKFLIIQMKIRAMKELPEWKPQNGFCQTSLATQEHDHATATCLLLGSHLNQVTRIHCKIK